VTINLINATLNDLKKDPLAVVSKTQYAPIAIWDGGNPAFYILPAQAYENLIEAIEDADLARIIESRKDEPLTTVLIHEL